MTPKRSGRRTERRRASRAEARVSMRVEGAPDDGARTQIVTESQNISASGVYCSSPHYLAPLSKVALTLVLPRLPGGRGAKELIKCDGIAVRCEPPVRRGERCFELACMFSGLDERRRIMLEEFVTWRNLQALRVAASRANGARRATSPLSRRAKTDGTSRRTATRRRTVH
jgi:hypothetical protein